MRRGALVMTILSAVAAAATWPLLRAASPGTAVRASVEPWSLYVLTGPREGDLSHVRGEGGDSLLLDPWGTPMRTLGPGLYSFGPDRVRGGGDDVVFRERVSNTPLPLDCALARSVRRALIGLALLSIVIALVPGRRLGLVIVMAVAALCGVLATSPASGSLPEFTGFAPGQAWTLSGTSALAGAVWGFVLLKALGTSSDAPS